MSSENYLAKEQRDPQGLRKTGLVVNLAGNLGKYASLMFGIYFVSREEPNLFYTAIGGVGYALSSALEHFADLCNFRAEGQQITTNIEESIDKLERKIKGRSSNIIAFPGSSNKLDRIVTDDLKKEGINIEENDNPKKPA